ncbi:hypothetical protein CBR_g35038 [Chara braunii]|uniref:Creatinase N-terminal domain-containing protein n=1 Tax=Chara braunii TaxID=69332 RepID=A0A388LKB8_CHABU|nr:hypothetical protein CBR_g35038 [Chara braunii]|eukprot:GBG82673.1 hypothetical protein CBR_g35038 [Chara braunii]
MAEMGNKLSSLRRLMESQSGGALQAYVVPSEDAHQSEYVAARDERRAFITGFTGSAGVAVVTATEALMWTDGRYFLQAEKQFVGTEWKLMRTGEDPALERWMADNLPPKSRVGFDPSCVSIDTVNIWSRALEKAGHKTVAVSQNLIDLLWKDRPAPKITKVVEHPIEFTGKSTKDKLKDLRLELREKRAFAIVVTGLDEANSVQIVGYNSILDDVRRISAKIMGSHGQEGLLRKSESAVSESSGKEDTSLDARDSIESHELKETSGSSVALTSEGRELRSQRNSVGDIDKTEDTGTPDNRAWKEGRETATPADSTELSDSLGGLPTSRDATAGASDSGSDVDVTQSVIGEAGEEKMKLWLDPAACNYAIFCAAALPTERLLQKASPIALAKALKQPAELDGMRNSHIRDAVALVRYFAWLDEQMQARYGVGGYFSESPKDISTATEPGQPDEFTEVTVADKLEEFRRPHLISFRSPPRNVPLMADMTVTIEPGYYEEGCFGIRIENVTIIKEVICEHNFGNKGFLGFEPITWVPIQTKLMDLSLMSEAEMNWVDEYHAQCRSKLEKLVPEEVGDWLRKATEPLQRPPCNK